MIPIWARIEGKWEQFPSHLLETLSDNSLGFRFDYSRDEYEKTAAFRRFREHFEHNPISWPGGLTAYEYRLKKPG